jgi:hypothetical protein
MRAYELLQEQTVEADALDALITLLTSMHAMDIEEIKIEQIIKSLEDQNFFVDYPWIINNVQDMGIVDTDASDEDKIVLKDVSGKTDQPTQEPQDQQEFDSEQQVDKMAKQALNKRIP